MNRRHLHNFLLKRVPRLFLCGVWLLSFSGTMAWGQQVATTRAYTLPEVIDLALTHNPTIEFGKGVIDEKAGDQMAASAYPNPSLGLQGGHGQVLDPTGPSLTERGISLSQPLEWPGTRAARKEAAEAGFHSAHASFEETRLIVKGRVKRNFYELLLAETLEDLASRLLKTVTDLNRAVKRRVESGEAPPFELVKVKVELLQAQKQVSRTRGKVRANKTALNQLTAGKLGEDFSIQGDFASGNTMVNEDRLIQNAFEHHPEIQKLQQLIEQASARHNQERQARVPNITISGTYQRVAGGEEFLGGVSLPLPIWNLREGEIAKTLGIRRQAEANLRHAQISLRKGITEQVQISETAIAQIDTFEQGLLKQAKEAVRIARTSFKFGEASLLDVLDAQRVLWQTFQGYAQARFELSVALTELERLVGKQW